MTAVCLTPACSIRTLKGMEMHFTPDIEAKLQTLATETGRTENEVVQDALAGYFEELAQVREMLDSRYDDIKSGQVQPIDGEAFFESLRQREEALLKKHASQRAKSRVLSCTRWQRRKSRTSGKLSPSRIRRLRGVSMKTSWPPSARWCFFPIKATGGLTSPPDLDDSPRYVIT